MKPISPIFEDRKRGTYMLALTFVLILALLALITYKAFAATEAEQPKTTTSCHVTYYMPKILGVIPHNVETTAIIDADLAQYDVNTINKALNVLTNHSVYKITAVDEDVSKALAVKISCPLRDGELDIMFKQR